ncbi:hypothetical protein [Endozoicomonas acroporae]|uniref:hypothetical protein n=1 Tax=Endozoicomonas acroporae TaxID=1701104 RepID=UPI003D7C0ACB
MTNLKKYTQNYKCKFKSLGFENYSFETTFYNEKNEVIAVIDDAYEVTRKVYNQSQFFDRPEMEFITYSLERDETRLSDTIKFNDSSLTEDENEDIFERMREIAGAEEDSFFADKTPQALEIDHHVREESDKYTSVIFDCCGEDYEF